MIEKECVYCKAKFLVRKYRDKTAKYCSKKCLALGSRVSVESECGVCGCKFMHISSRCNIAKYCSRKCYYLSNKGRGHTTFTCKHCEKQFNAPASTKRVYCSKECVSKNSKTSWHPKFTTVRKKMIRLGEINICSDCGYSENPTILGLHHIDGNRDNNSRENLVVLCPNCHSLRHSKHIVHSNGYKDKGE